jgi:hypothetical protein
MRCSPRRYRFPANEKRSSASDVFLPTPKCRHRLVESCMPDRSSGSIASLTIRSSGNLMLLRPSRRCIFHRLYRSSASHKSIFPGFRRWRVSTPPFTPSWRRSHVSFRSPKNCNVRVSNATGFTAFRANRSCINLQTICRVIAHLGNGASVTAVKGGKSIDTSMGLTQTGG